MYTAPYNDMQLNCLDTFAFDNCIYFAYVTLQIVLNHQMKNPLLADSCCRRTFQWCQYSSQSAPYSTARLANQNSYTGYDVDYRKKLQLKVLLNRRNLMSKQQRKLKKIVLTKILIRLLMKEFNIVRKSIKDILPVTQPLIIFL